MTHLLLVAALWLLFALAMTALVAVVWFTEPGAYERYRRAVAYHRHHARHARRDGTDDTRPFPALTAAEAAT